MDAIVNSEQTDFTLAISKSTISGQIYHRFGPQIQDELNDQVKLHGGIAFGRKPLDLGTVLRTTAGPNGGQLKAIFYAGFHHAWFSYHEDDEDFETDHCRSFVLVPAKFYAWSLTMQAFHP